MDKDNRYLTVKQLVDGGYITTFSDIFIHIPVTTISDHLGTNYARLKKLIAKPDLFSFNELFRIGAYFEIDRNKMIELVMNQIGPDKKANKTTAKK